MQAYEEFNSLMSHMQNELSSTSTSSIVGPVSGEGEETEERSEDSPALAPPPETFKEVITTQTITIPKMTSLGIVPIGLVTA